MRRLDKLATVDRVQQCFKVAAAGGSKYTSAYGWSTNPTAVWTAAKARAAACVDQDNPKLTALERAFWERLRAVRG